MRVLFARIDENTNHTRNTTVLRPYAAPWKNEAKCEINYEARKHTRVPYRA